MKFLKMLGAGLAAFFAVSTSAYSQDATYPFIDVKSDVGSYDPVALGEDIQLDGCGTSIWAASGTSTFSWCDITDYAEFSLSWSVWNWDTWSWTTFASFSGNSVGSGLTAVVNTGVGSPFTSAGVYYIGLLAEVTSSQYSLGKDVSITLPGGLIRYPGGDSSLSYDGSTNRGFDYTALVIDDAASVPEPLGALLLLPGLIYMARRERRRRKA
ncbi:MULTISPECIES: hypothetical protein [Kordiimonas]|jgi:hypothetical protein|uniref:PEP-CTERM protein-sorting domain-containing protein n=1 Tax=Kordiimonas lacus TaxID=637679 RepID=A0A1G7CF44_9PROT|nr:MULTISPECIES: hypothetical protein [Kordiimonas]SDE37045.1 hypothetical protein SAMN04488071_2748 [Kordiimonas lacus]